MKPYKTPIKVNAFEEKNTKKKFVDVSDALKPFMLAQCLMGLRKVSFTKDNVVIQKGFYEKLYSSVFCLAFTIGSGVFCVHRFITFLTKTSLNLAIIYSISLVTSTFACFNAIMISTYFAPEWIKDLFDNFHYMDSNFPCDKKVYRKMRKIMIGILTVYILFLILEILFNIYTLKFSLGWILSYVDIMLIDFVNVELMMYLYLLTVKMRDMNKVLANFNNVFNKPHKNMTLSTLSGSLIEKKNPLIVLYGADKTNETSEKVITNLMLIYDKVADSVHLLNITFGTSLLLSAMVAFEYALYTINAFINSNDSSGMSAISIIEWWFRCLLTILVGAVFSEKLSGECSKTTIILDKNIFQLEKGSIVRGHFEKFSLLTSSRKIYVTACNFFNYDYTFIVSITAALVSYSVILLQGPDLKKLTEL